MPDATQQEREAYAAFVEQYTGRDMAYHERNGTTGLDFGLAAFLAGRASLPSSGEYEQALRKVLRVLQTTSYHPDKEEIFEIVEAALSAKEPRNG